MKKLKCYLDTSIISAYYDERDLEKKEKTIEMWKELINYEVYISELVVAELERDKDIKKRSKKLTLVNKLTKLKVTEEAGNLAELYIRHKIIPRKYEGDALHIAIAVINNTDIIISWNFAHMVKLKTKREVNAINLLQGYREVDIVSPWEI